jgi:hypothetical protein
MVIPSRWRRRANPPGPNSDRVSSMSNTRGNVLHLCRFPEKCCTTCDRHRERCAHPIGRGSW